MLLLQLSVAVVWLLRVTAWLLAAGLQPALLYLAGDTVSADLAGRELDSADSAPCATTKSSIFQSKTSI